MSTVSDFADAIHLVRKFDNFPRAGVNYYDLTPLLRDAMFFGRAMERLARQYSRKRIDCIIAPESRGYMFGAALANKLGAGFVPAARYGVLPGKTISVQCPGGYHHEVDAIKELTLREDDLKPGTNVLIVDDILGSGHTSTACVQLAEKLGAKVVGAAFILEITKHNGRDRLKSLEDVFSLMQV
jgi:adenine phosphoribosyltransferase